MVPQDRVLTGNQEWRNCPTDRRHKDLRRRYRRDEAEVAPVSGRTTTTYDAVRNVTRITYPNLEQENFTYDDLNRQETMQNPAGHVMTYVYDDEARTQSTLDFNGNRTTQTFDERGSLESFKTAELIVATFTYDAVGNPQVAIDGKGQRTTYSYTDLNLLNVEQDPLGYRTTLQLRQRQLPGAVHRHEEDLSSSQSLDAVLDECD